MAASNRPRPSVGVLPFSDFCIRLLLLAGCNSQPRRYLHVSQCFPEGKWREVEGNAWMFRCQLTDHRLLTSIMCFPTRPAGSMQHADNFFSRQKNGT